MTVRMGWEVDLVYVSVGEICRQEDVKKLISLSFRDFIFDPKCLPTPQRSLIRHPRAIFLTPSSLQILKSLFSHLPDNKSLKGQD
jgi:hypothetical protein